MHRVKKRRSVKAGMAPGTLVHIGEKRTEQTRIHLIAYGEDHLQEADLDTVEAALPGLSASGVSWVNIDGLHDIALIETVGREFRIHPLTLEDILNTGQRPKAEEFEDYIFVVFKLLRFDPDACRLDSEQISLVIGDGYLLSFQEVQGDAFDPVRERLRKGKGRIRSGGCSYLAYALIDAVVDQYYTVLELIGDRIENLEEALLDNPPPEVAREIHGLKRELISFRKQVMPMRQLVTSLLKSDSALIQQSTDVFISDIYDHTIQVIDTLESYRDVLSGLLEVYLSGLSNRLNEVMKVLTMIATIFIPLSFIAGVYGMNFKDMPELSWKWGYPAAWALMLLIALLMLFVFRKKKWF